MTKKIGDILLASYDPRKNAKQMLAHQATERHILYGGAYGGGKTSWLVGEAIQLSFEYPYNRGFLGCKFGTDFKANALKQLEKFLPPQMMEFEEDGHKEKIKVWEHHKVEQLFTIYNGAQIIYGGLGNDAEAIKTISNMPELGWFGIDQAEQITERQYLLLCGRLRLVLPGIRYKALLTANPEPGWLRDRFIENCYPDHRFIPALPKDNPFLPSDYEENLKKIYPEGLVKRLLGGDWDVETEGDKLIPYALIRAAINRNLEPEGNKIAGVDVARQGIDETVFLLRQGDKVLYVESWAKEDTTFSAGNVADLIRKHKPVMTYIDDISVGVGVLDPLKNEGFAVQGVNVGRAAFDEARYVNRRAEYFSQLAKRFETGAIDIPDNNKLQSQLASLRFTFRGSKFLMRSKESMRKKGVKSPDYADALMLAFIETPASGPTNVIPVKHWG